MLKSEDARKECDFLELEKVLAGKMVIHSKLGQGTIEEISDSYLIVRFDQEDKVSRFVYPDAFDKFLTLGDAESNAIVEKHLRIKRLIDAEQERRKREQLKKLDDELKLKHKEEMVKKQKAAMAKIAREKRLKDKKKVMA